jgi:signal transduction histidine kinase
VGRAVQHEEDFEGERVRHLVRQAPTGFVAGTLTVAAVVLVLWSAAPRERLLLWLGVIALLTAPAFFVVWRFTFAASRPPVVASWRRVLIVVYGLAGAGWGALPVLLYPGLEQTYRLFILFIIGSAGVGGMAALAPVRSVFVAYMMATFLPTIGVLVAAGSVSSIVMGLLLSAFGIATILLASEHRALLIRSMRLRFENLALIDDLSRARDDAEAASGTKSRFLANVSHELRTHVALILGPTRRILASPACGPRTRRDLETVERNAEALLKNVTDLLDVAKLEAGTVELERLPLDLVELVRRTTSLFEIVARERDVDLAVDTADPVRLVGDAGKLERVVLNLLSNALKFVPDGGRVRVGVTTVGDAAVLTVEDNGPGVPIPLRETIFERFRQGEGRFGGTGLGLAIAREIVERHGGRIEVGDAAEGGALFRATLPVTGEVPGAAEAEMPHHERAALDVAVRRTIVELRRAREPDVRVSGNEDLPLVLVVEDNAEMSRFLVDSLAPDYRVTTAPDGAQGLEMALAIRPDLVVTDIMMPAMGGDALVRAVRTHPELDGTPIVVLTAMADDELRVQLLREGAQDFLTKPFAADELRARVANFVMLKRARDVLQSALSSRSRDVAGLADELAAANRAKDEFLAVLSHELRTPLTPILSWTVLLREGMLDDATRRRAIETIERNARLQARMVDDLLDVSRAITGKLRLNVAPIALEPVIQAALASAASAAAAKAIRVETELPDPGLVSGDPERLQQVVWNLLSNAIKFAPRGGRVAVRLVRVADQAQLTVSDDGPGIAPTLLPRVFERFWQADSSMTRAQGGLGIGLAVVRQIVELHGGTVRAESEGEGRGATFTVTLPVLSAVGDCPPEDPVAPARSTRFHGLKALVVDDDADTCEIVGAVLAKAGAEVRTCLSASQALAAMDAWVPDILVSDIAMPGQDGYALIRKVRARRTEEGGAVPAVALTAYGRSEDRMKALSAGFQVHVGKPVEPRQLVNVVASVTGYGAAPAPPPDTPPAR